MWNEQNRLCHNQKCEPHSTKPIWTAWTLNSTSECAPPMRSPIQWFCCFLRSSHCFTFAAVSATKYVLVVHHWRAFNAERSMRPTARALIKYLFYVVTAILLLLHFNCIQMEMYEYISFIYQKPCTICLWNASNKIRAEVSFMCLIKWLNSRWIRFAHTKAVRFAYDSPKTVTNRRIWIGTFQRLQQFTNTNEIIKLKF